MLIVDLYIRVSTDEQALGYSLRDQEDRLRKYCEIHNIHIRKVIVEDYSAKTFLRPGWKSLMLDLKKHKGQIGGILFTKWDRFSRNAGDAYQMIGALRKLGVEPQAVEQPLDLSVPENKMMLAFYLAAPEVENDRRALNTFHGMRRAKKEGRYMGGAPTGYINKISETGKKYISPLEPQASIVRWIFEKLAEGNFTTEQLWKEASRRGLKCNKKNLWVLVRNPVYCGKIFIPKWKDEEAEFVNGLHEPLITPALFYQAQDTLDGRKRAQRTTLRVDESIPLRGFLICPKCTRLLTGSTSRGRSSRYTYYHCTGGCDARFKADVVNDLFVTELKKYNMHPATAELYMEVLCDAYETRLHIDDQENRQINARLNQAYNDLSNARNLLMKGHIGPDDFHAMKQVCDNTINSLQAKVIEMETGEFNVKHHAKKIANATSRLDRLYVNSDIVKKRDIVGSIFPEKLTFDGNGFRTARVNEIVSLLYSLDKGFSQIKNGVNRENFAMYPEVTHGVHFSNHFRQDHKRLSMVFNDL